MGKGDITTKRGKIFRGSFGKTRPRKLPTASTAPVAAPKAVKRK
jgi:ribosomal small subunit protein bTHX